MENIVNISSYRFVALPDAEALQKTFRQFCSSLDLKGTVIFSPEGINVGVAGSRAAIDAFVGRLLSDDRFSGMVFKESLSHQTPFRKMFVKLKSMLVPSSSDIDPSKMTGKRLMPKELKQWLDEGKEIVLIDTRNDYEYQVGTFENAICLPIEEFRDFEEAVKALPETLRKKPVVMFCTGGIRCEKATPIGMKVGFEEVYQLEGGILDYFKDCEGAHWQGECFVFDERVTVDPALGFDQNLASS